jgi:putative transposase
MAMYRNKYRVETTRLAGWDYSSPGHYFVTVCTKSHEEYFGEVVGQEMVLSDLGRVARECWIAIASHFPFAAADAFVVMPNHVHGIVVITSEGPLSAGNAFGPQSGNLAAVVRGYKVGVKKYATAHGRVFHWQPRFYEHVIRNEGALARIRNYIETNPQRWEFDEYNRTRQARSTL